MAAPLHALDVRWLAKAPQADRRLYDISHGKVRLIYSNLVERIVKSKEVVQ
jgi:hypothetical protein